jgi:hypothetical protein
MPAKRERGVLKVAEAGAMSARSLGRHALKGVSGDREIFMPISPAEFAGLIGLRAA